MMFEGLARGALADTCDGSTSFLSYNVIPRPQFLSILNAFYDPTTRMASPNIEADTSPTPEWTSETHPHKLALVFIILAVGLWFNFDTVMQSDQDKERADRYFKLCTQCLAVTNFLSNNTMSSVQTLHILVNFQL